jgi:hypothetical protein
LCQNGGLSVVSSARETEKVGLVVGDSRVAFGKRLHGAKKKCETVRCRDAADSSFVANAWGEVFAPLYAVAVKRHSGMQIGYLACQHKFFVNNPLDVKKKLMSMLLTLLFTCLTFFGLSECGLTHWEGCRFVLRAITLGGLSLCLEGHNTGGLSLCLEGHNTGRVVALS